MMLDSESQATAKLISLSGPADAAALSHSRNLGQTLRMKSVDPALFPYASKQLAVGPHMLRYIDEGSGPETLLCVHGNPTWSFYYRGVIDRFRDTYRVIAVDHIGCGRSDKPTRKRFPYTLAAHRDNLVQLIESLDLNRVTLIAHDWGGAIGLASLVARQDRFNRIVLLNTGAFPPPYVPLRIAACRIPLLGTLGVRGLNLFARMAVTMAMSRHRLDDSVAQGLLAPYDNWANRVAVDSFVRDIPMSKRHPTFDTLAQLDAALPSLADLPSLLVWGMKDWCFRPECLHRFQTVWPHAKTVAIEDAGHYVIEDARHRNAGGNRRLPGREQAPQCAPSRCGPTRWLISSFRFAASVRHRRTRCVGRARWRRSHPRRGTFIPGVRLTI